MIMSIDRPDFPPTAMNPNEELARHISRELVNRENLMFTFRTRIGFILLVGPFIVLGSAILATGGIRFGEDSWAVVWQPVTAIAVCYVLLAVIGGVIEQQGCRQCNRLREHIVNLLNDPSYRLPTAAYRDSADRGVTVVYAIAYSLMLVSAISMACVATMLAPRRNFRESHWWRPKIQGGSKERHHVKGENHRTVVSTVKRLRERWSSASADGGRVDRYRVDFHAPVGCVVYRAVTYCLRGFTGSWPTYVGMAELADEGLWSASRRFVGGTRRFGIRREDVARRRQAVFHGPVRDVSGTRHRCHVAFVPGGQLVQVGNPALEYLASPVVRLVLLPGTLQFAVPLLVDDYPRVVDIPCQDD